MDKEMSAHKNGKQWQVVRKSEVKQSIIKAMWTFKRKRDPTGVITKHKARTCAHGYMQRWGESYYETHAPVVNWLSVRFLLTMSIALNLDTRSIDFTMACLQEKLKKDVYVETPWG